MDALLQRMKAKLDLFLQAPGILDTSQLITTEKIKRGRTERTYTHIYTPHPTQEIWKVH